MLRLEVVGCHIDVVPLRRIAVNEIFRLAWCISKAFKLADSLSKLLRIVFRIYYFLSVDILFNQGRCKLEEPVSAAAFPANSLGDAALVLSIDNLVHPHLAVCIAVISKLHTDPPPPHLVCHRRRCAGAKEGIKHKIARLGGHFQNSPNKHFRFFTVFELHTTFFRNSCKIDVRPKISQ